MSHDPKKFLQVLAAANEKMDLHVKVYHDQIYRQVSFTNCRKVSQYPIATSFKNFVNYLLF